MGAMKDMLIGFLQSGRCEYCEKQPRPDCYWCKQLQDAVDNMEEHDGREACMGDPEEHATGEIK